MKIKTGKTAAGQNITTVVGKDFDLIFVEKPKNLKSNKAFSIRLLEKNHYQIETTEGILTFAFTDSFNVKTELAGLTHKLDTFNLEQEAALLNSLSQIAAREFIYDKERKQLAQIGQDRPIRNWRDFYEAARDFITCRN